MPTSVGSGVARRVATPGSEIESAVPETFSPTLHLASHTAVISAQHASRVCL